MPVDIQIILIYNICMSKRKKQSKTPISKKGEKIYQKEIKNKVEPKMSGNFLALNVKTKDYFIADNIIQADNKGRRRYPNEVFYIKKIGSPAAISIAVFKFLNQILAYFLLHANKKFDFWGCFFAI